MRFLERSRNGATAGAPLKRYLRNSVTACGLSYWAASRRRAESFAVLCYHRVLERPDPWYSFSLTRELFERELALLKRFCSVLPLDEIITRLERGHALPPRCVALTFDDGYRDVYTDAWPLLRRYQLPATLFVTVQAIAQGWLWPDLVRHAVRNTQASGVTLRTAGGSSSTVAWRTASERCQAVEQIDGWLKEVSHEEKERALDALLAELTGSVRAGLTFPGLMLSWEELRRLHAEGMEIGAHSMTHPVLSRMPESSAAEEIAASRAELEKRLGAPVRHFCYPNGRPQDVSSAIRRCVEQAGFHSACTTVHGLNRPSEDRFLLKRVGTTHDSLRTFTRVLEEAAA